MSHLEGPSPSPLARGRELRSFRFHAPMREKACAAPRFLWAWRGSLGFRAEAELTAEPGPGVDPEPVSAAGAHPQGCGGLSARQPCEIAQLDEPGLDGILLRQPAQRGVQGQDIQV